MNNDRYIERRDGCIMVVFCRTDFLKVVEKYGEDKDNGFRLNGKKIVENTATEDLMANLSISFQAMMHPLLKDLHPGAVNTGMDIEHGTPEHLQLTYLVDASNKGQYVEEGLAWLNGALSDAQAQFGDTPIDYPMEDQYKLLVKGNMLFVGVAEGFVASLQNKEAMRSFLTNCLEQCKSKMQSQALTASPLYRRFIFSNVNV